MRFNLRCVGIPGKAQGSDKLLADAGPVYLGIGGYVSVEVAYSAIEFSQVLAVFQLLLLSVAAVFFSCCCFLLLLCCDDCVRGAVM